MAYKKHQSLANSFLIFQFFKSFITSLNIFICHLLAKLPPTLNIQNIQGQELYSILSGQPNHGNLLFGIYSLMLFNYSPFLSSTKGILSSGLILLTYVNIFASFFSSLIISSILASQASFGNTISCDCFLI